MVSKDKVGDDGEPCPCSWLDKAKAICMVIGAATTAVASIAAAVLGAINHQKIESVQGQQAVQVEQADAVKGELHSRSVVTDQKLGAIQKTSDKTAKVVDDTTGPTLWASWKFLQQLADDDKTPENVKKAAEAKAAYDKWKTSQTKP